MGIIGIPIMLPGVALVLMALLAPHWLDSIRSSSRELTAGRPGCGHQVVRRAVAAFIMCMGIFLLRSSGPYPTKRIGWGLLAAAMGAVGTFQPEWLVRIGVVLDPFSHHHRSRPRWHDALHGICQIAIGVGLILAV